MKPCTRFALPVKPDSGTQLGIPRISTTHGVTLRPESRGGTTLIDGTYRNALNQQGGYQNLHHVYNRTDRPCPRCRASKIVRIVQTQRSTFFCKRCQKRTGCLSQRIGSGRTI